VQLSLCLVSAVICLASLAILFRRTSPNTPGRLAAWPILGVIFWVLGRALIFWPIARNVFPIPIWLPALVLACGYLMGCTLLLFAAGYPARMLHIRRVSFALIPLGLIWLSLVYSQIIAVHPFPNVWLCSSAFVPAFRWWLLLCCLMPLLACAGYLRQAYGAQRRRIRYALGGLAFIVSGLLLDLWFHHPGTAYSYGFPSFLLLSCGVLTLGGYAAARLPLLDGRVLLRPLLSGGLTTVTVFMIFRAYAFTLAIHCMHLFPSFTIGSLLLISEFLIVSAFYPLYCGYAWLVNSFLLKFPYNSRQVIDAVGSVVTSANSRASLVARMSQIVSGTLRPQSCAFYLPDATGVHQRIDGSTGQLVLPDRLAPTAGLLLALRTRKVILQTDGLLDHADALGEEMQAQNIAVAVPLFHEQQVTGCLLLSEKSSGDAYLREDLRMLAVIGAQTSLALENVQHFEELQALNVGLEERIAARTCELAEANTQLQDADRAKDRFLAMVSHELLNPLSSILGWAEMGLMTNDPDRRTKALTTIQRSGLQQQRLIRDLLDTSRIIHGKLTITLQPVDLWQIVLGVIESLDLRIRERNITVELIPPTAALRLSGDPARLHQVISNLLGNALKFTDRGGRITFTGALQADHCMLTVQDTGKGIAAKDLSRIFTLFHQASGDELAGGLGLGLGLVRGIMELHGGTVTAASPGEGMGSTFTISIPAAPSVQPDANTDQTLVAAL
jgi:signal transduction histidine kinase